MRKVLLNELRTRGHNTVEGVKDSLLWMEWSAKPGSSLDDFLRGNALERAQVYEILNRIGAMSVEQIQREAIYITNLT